jgi:hypothetical protein
VTVRRQRWGNAVLVRVVDGGDGPTAAPPGGVGRVMAVAALGYTAVFWAVTATAYAGRAPCDRTVPYAILLGAAVLTTGAAAAVVLAQTSPARRAPAPAAVEGNPSPAGRTGT